MGAPVAFNLPKPRTVHFYHGKHGCPRSRVTETACEGIAQAPRRHNLSHIAMADECGCVFGFGARSDLFVNRLGVPRMRASAHSVVEARLGWRTEPDSNTPSLANYNLTKPRRPSLAGRKRAWKLANEHRYKPK